MHVHFLGIGGSGISAAASLAKLLGFDISGCDVQPHTEFTTRLPQDKLLTNHYPDHIKNADILAITPAVLSLDPYNSEVVAAKEKGIPIITWQQFVGNYLTKDKSIIAVCGTHGKSTTTAMIAQMLEDGGLDPLVILGAIVPRWKTNYRFGHGKYFIIEADEFNDNFFAYTPDIIVLTSIEMDHPEYFDNFDALKTSFRTFLCSAKQKVVANLKDEGVVKTISPGLSCPGQPFHPIDDTKFIIDYSQTPINFTLKIPGDFNILNASAASQVGQLLNMNPETIKNSLANFGGISRRFELIGEFHEAKIFSDFGHHPTEIKVTMQAARQKFPDEKIWLIFQPHMFSRTKALFEDFVSVFQELTTNSANQNKIVVNGIAVLDIYPSREKDIGLVNSKELVASVGNKHVEYVPSWENLKISMQQSIGQDDVLFFMGAGDTDKWAKELAKSAPA